jgi:hypothetical protein
MRFDLRILQFEEAQPLIGPVVALLPSDVVTISKRPDKMDHHGQRN